MNDSQKPKRRVNPALLLGGVDSVKESQPSLVDAENFPERTPRNTFRKPEDVSGVKKASTPPLPKVAPPSPKTSKPALPVVKAPAPKTVNDDVVEKTVSGLPVGKAPKKDTVDAPVDVVIPVVESVSDSGTVSEPEVPAGHLNPKVSPDGDKPVRRVNPLFLAGEEKEHVSGAVPLKQERQVRPNFILQGEKTPVRLPKRPEKPGAVPFQKLPEGEAKERPQYARKIESNVEFEDWGDDDEGTQFGLGGEIDSDFVEPQYSKAFHLTERDLIVMRFLARYRYAYTDQLARLVDTMPRTISARLRVLEKRGFVRKEAITERQYLWTTRKAGNLLVDISFPEIRKGSISYATIAHTIGLGNLGVEFEREAGGKDLLGEGKGLTDWVMPENRFKLGIWGNPDGKTLGEMTITEREIRQGQLRWRGGRSSKEMRGLVSLAASSPEGPELEEGQEGLFVVYGEGGKGGEHIPDLVVARPRDEDGKPQHIAIELELTAKSNSDWRKILRNYRDNAEMFHKIYYFTHKRVISTALQRMGEEVGLGDRLVIRKYSPQSGRLPFWG